MVNRISPLHWLLLSAGLLTACASPTAMQPAARPLDASGYGQDAAAVPDAATQGAWWRALHIAELDQLIDDARRQHPSLTEAEARIRALVDSGFFDHHFLATEGLVDIERFSAMFGIFGLAECVDDFMARQGRPDAHYGHDQAANVASYRITERLAELVAARPLPYCSGGGGYAYLHSQSGIDLDLEVTAGTRLPIGTEPGLREHIAACAPHHRLFPAGISDIFHVDETVRGNPRAMVDVVRGALGVGMRDFTFNLADNEFIRITGYLVRKSDLVGIEEHGAVKPGRVIQARFAGSAERVARDVPFGDPIPVLVAVQAHPLQIAMQVGQALGGPLHVSGEAEDAQSGPGENGRLGNGRRSTSRRHHMGEQAIFVHLLQHRQNGVFHDLRNLADGCEVATFFAELAQERPFR